MTKILFLPGSGASPEFWKPVGEKLPAERPKEYFGWPGLGRQPPDPAINGMDDLVAMVVARMDGAVDLVAQSMGGVVAARIALTYPQRVRRLVLTVTSGGVDMVAFGASDWRAAYRAAFPEAAEWIYEPRAAAPLPVERITAATLLIWGDSDPISPIAVGRHLEKQMPKARLELIAGGDHDVARTHAADVAALVERHLTA
jgi:pimeloyl-ACP methyl ester carboxylesterase